VRAEELLRHNFLGLETGGRNLVVQFEGSGESADSHSSVQRFEAGRLVEWSPGTTQDANLTLRLQGDIDKFILGVIDGKQSGAVQMNTADDGWTALPPMDVPKTCQLPRIPGATVILQRIEIGPPLGQFKYFEIFEDGELMSRTSGSVKDPDVSVTMTYEQSLRWRVSNIDLLTGSSRSAVGRRSPGDPLIGIHQ